jgi:hypothetical protein
MLDIVSILPAVAEYTGVGSGDIEAEINDSSVVDTFAMCIADTFVSLGRLA